MDVDQNPLPIPWKFEKGHGSVEKQMFSLHTSGSILLPFSHQLLGGFGRKSYKKKLLESADRTGILLKPLAVDALLWSLACLRWTFCNWNGNNLIVPLDELVQESFILLQMDSYTRLWVGPRLIILSVLRFILLTFLLGKVNIVVLLHVVGNAWPYPQIVLALEQKPAENSTSECGVTVKRLYTATPSVIDEHLFGVFYHCLFDIINLSGWSIFQWYCTLGHFSPFCLIPLPSFISGVCRFQPFRVFFTSALLMDTTYLDLSTCCAR